MPCAGAHAADLSRLLSPPALRSVPHVQEFVSGWYLRGDIGYRFQHLGGASDTVFDYGGNASIDNTFMAGGGAGIQLGWLRLEATGDYGWRTDFSGTTASGADGVSMKVETATVLFNGYIDLGTWYGMTPYVGAGLGTAYVNTSNYQMTPVQLGSAVPQDRWNWAWAVMAGVSYTLTYNTKVDIGYRHVDMGDAVGGTVDNPVTLEHLSGDEIRIGLRYILD
jgi:opacity protein-like surface antigen